MGGNVRIGDQPFAAVDHIIVAVADRGGADVHARSEIGLGQAEGDRFPALRDIGQDFLQHLLRCGFQQAVARGIMDVHQHADAALDLRELRQDRQILAGGQPDPAIALRDQQPESAHLAEQRIDDLVRDMLLILDLLLQRIEIAPDRLENALLERLIFVIGEGAFLDMLPHHHRAAGLSLRILQRRHAIPPDCAADRRTAPPRSPRPGARRWRGISGMLGELTQ